MEITEALLRRAEYISRDVHSVPEAVYGAVLAADAQEYLGYRTPTTSIQALALKHVMEVTAECMFSGVTQTKDIEQRLQEISQEVDSICVWFAPEARKRSNLDVAIGIIGELVLKFRQHYQFDEEQLCLNELRNLHRKLWFQKQRFGPTRLSRWLERRRLLRWLRRNPVTRLIEGSPMLLDAWSVLLAVPLIFRWYVEKLVSSVRVFVIAIILWVAVLSVLYESKCDRCWQDYVRSRPANEANTMIYPVPPRHIHLPFEHGVGHAVTAFFGIQPPHTTQELEDYGDWPFFITLIAIIAGFTHLGIFVSHVYSLIARR